MHIISNRKKFVESEYAPDNTNVYWVTKVENKFKSIKEFINGNWKDVMGVKDEDDNQNPLPADYELPNSMTNLTKLHVQLAYDPWSKQAVIYIEEGDLSGITSNNYYQAVFLPVNTYSTDSNDTVLASTAIFKVSTNVTPNTIIYANLLYNEFTNNQAIYITSLIRFPENFIKKYGVE